MSGQQDSTGGKKSLTRGMTSRLRRVFGGLNETPQPNKLNFLSKEADIEDSKVPIP
jgi:hypothetical protein